MAKLHLSFRNIRADVLDAARTLFDAKPWAEDDEKKIKLANEFVRTASAAYGVASPEVVLDPVAYYLNYNPAEAEMDDALHLPESIQAAQIVLGHWSITNLFAGFRIHLLNSGKEERPNTVEPWGWACSLFYSVRPIMFRARVREGRIGLVHPVDLLSRNTLSRLTTAGLANEDGELLHNGVTVALLERVEAGELDADAVLRALDEADGPEGEELEEAWNDFVEAHVEPEAEVVQVGASDSASVTVTEDDGLDALGITALRQLSRGVFSGGYSLSKSDLIAKLREHGVRA